jgi:putative aminopeptidase FrvX
LFTGSEEAGDRGAEAFGYAHSGEYNQIDSTVVNLESITDSYLQKIVAEEKTTRTKCDPAISDLLAQCAEELSIRAQKQVLPAIAGGTDCAGFAKGGLRVSGLEGIRYNTYLH